MSVSLRRVLVGAAALAALLASCSGSSASTEPAPLPTEHAAQELRDFAARIDADSFARNTLDRCPFDDHGELMERAFAATESGLVRQALGGEVFASVDPGEGILPPFVVCSRVDFEDFDGLRVGVAILVAPEDVDAAITTRLDGESRSDEFERPHRNGTLNGFCVVDDERDWSDCEVGWYDEHLWVIQFVSGEAADVIALESLEAGLTSVLDDLIGAVAV